MTKKKTTASSPREKLVTVSAEDIFNRPLSKRDRAALSRVVDDSDIDCSDIPELTEEDLARLRPAREVFPEDFPPLRDARPKVQLSLRVEPRVVEWLKRKGPGYQGRINSILVEAMLAEQKAAARK